MFLGRGLLARLWVPNRECRPGSECPGAWSPWPHTECHWCHWCWQTPCAGIESHDLRRHRPRRHPAPIESQCSYQRTWRVATRHTHVSKQSAAFAMQTVTRLLFLGVFEIQMAGQLWNLKPVESIFNQTRIAHPCSSFLQLLPPPISTLFTLVHSSKPKKHLEMNFHRDPGVFLFSEAPWRR